MCFWWIAEQSSIEQKWNTDTQISFQGTSFLHGDGLLVPSGPCSPQEEHGQYTLSSFVLLTTVPQIRTPFWEPQKIDTDLTKWHIIISYTNYRNCFGQG